MTTLKTCLEKAPFDTDIEKCYVMQYLGVTHTKGQQALSRLMNHDGRGVKCQDLLSVRYNTASLKGPL